MMKADLYQELKTRFGGLLFDMLAESLEPTERPDIIEWAKENIYLPSQMAKPGYYDPDFAPYQREILYTLAHDDDIDEVILLMGSQTGKTQCLLIYLMYVVQYYPSLTKFLLPNDDLADNVSAERIQPAIDNCKPVKALSSNAERRDGKNSVRRKQFTNGSTLTVGNTGLPRDVTSTPSRICIIDEYSKAIFNLNPAGDIVSLVRQRQETFYDSKLVVASTPLDEETCLITAEYLDTDKRIYENKCINCSEYFQITLDDIQKITKPDEARIVCPCCGFEYDDVKHKQLVKVGRWRKTGGKSRRAGFFINSFASPFFKLPAFAEKYTKAIGDPAKEKQIINENLCLTYKQTGQRMAEQALHDRAEDYDHLSIPNNVLYLTVGGDTQADRLEAVVIGHGDENETYAIKRFVVLGSPDNKRTWEDLHSALQKTQYIRQDGATLKILKGGFDTGGATEEIGAFDEHVKAFCKKYARYGYIPIKGSSQYAAEPFRAKKSKVSGTDKVYMVGVSKIKEMLYSWLTTKLDPEKDVNPGYWHFSKDCDEEFFHQLTGEERVIVRKNGKKTPEWRKISEKRRVEVLDCCVYAIAAKYALPYHTIDSQKSKLNRQLSKKQAETSIDTIEQVVLESNLENTIKPEDNRTLYDKLREKRARRAVKAS